MSYTELLVPENGVYEFVYPTVVGPRYSNQSAETAPENSCRASPVQAAATNGGAGLWHHQERAGLPAISAARRGKSRAGMAVGLCGLQPQTAAHLGGRLKIDPARVEKPGKRPSGAQL